ncbi:phage Gp37/Gp68 family protein [Methylobacterium sp. WL6]|uniref:phage Gp37/Gp68 family protein n=1 Tax=Methylobacterium sp. WL6 TaxID=2603901 RepID=UPI0011C9431F|nr:phage Gp37/Gp68 family protein [Methylobacterium sp. WL6]TXN64473.1 phage Gp37/Gp68 family protein [Methylobacterium sp. WL6]
MADQTGIEWTDATWNPITGCSVVSPGCTNCYAMRLAGTRLRHHPSRAGLTLDSKAGPVWNGEVRLNEAWLTQPLLWTRPRRIFVCAHGDLFHENVPDAWIDRVFAVMALCPQHTFQVLTKRSARMQAYMTGCEEPPADLPLREMWVTQWHRRDHVARAMRGLGPRFEDRLGQVRRLPLPNVWLGVSAEDQRRADERVPDLLAAPAAVRFVSAEPLLDAIDFTAIACPNGCHPPEYCNRCHPDGGEAKGTFDALATGELDLIIVGGENGPRATHPAWVREIRDQCAAYKTSFFFKQWGAWQPREWCRDGGTHAMRSWGGQISFQAIQSHPNSIERVGAGPEWSAFARVGKKAAGRLLDGVEHDGMPEVRT